VAVITNITASNLVNEAFDECGIDSATSTQKTRAEDYFLQFILNDIMNTAFKDGNTRLKTLQETLLDASVEGQRTLDLAEDMDEEILVEVLDGSRRNTAQTGNSTTITLVSSDSGTASNTEGRWIFLTGGTGADQIRQVTDYNATTKVATVDSAWSTTPTSSTTYLVVDNVYPLDEVNISEIESSATKSTGRPTCFAKYNRQIIFDRAFDRSTYGIRLRYYMNVHELDRTEGSTSRYTRVLQNWQSVLVTGVAWKILEDIDDNRQISKIQEYETKKQGLLVKEIPYGGEFAGFAV
jgi:hypothetical protein